MLRAITSALAIVAVEGWLAGTALGATAAPAPVSCRDVRVTASVFATVGPSGQGWTENLGFDGHGGMWVSELELGRVVRFNSRGKPGTSIAVAHPGAEELGFDGRMYLDYGDSVPSGSSPGQAGVERFNPRSAKPTLAPFASGLPMANGGAFDSAGNLYVSNTDGAGIVQIRPNGKIDPAFARATAGLSGADGLTVSGPYLYATLLTDPTSPVIRIPLDHPSRYSTVVKLSDEPGAGNKGLDDLTIGPDGRLYVASAAGQLLRVDPFTGAACLLYSGVPLTSVRFVLGFPPFNEQTDLFLTSETGEIIHAHLVTRHRKSAG